MRHQAGNMASEAPTTPAITVYWPQRRLHGALSKEGGQGERMVLTLVGFCIDEKTFCVVDIVAGQEAIPQGLVVVGSCRVFVGGVNEAQMDAAPCTPRLLQCAIDTPIDLGADAIDLQLRITGLHDSSGSVVATHFNVVFFDPILCERGYLRRGVMGQQERSTMRGPLLLLCDWFESHTPAQSKASNVASLVVDAVEAFGYYCLFLPSMMIKVVVQVFSVLLSARLPKWTPLGAGTCIKDCSQFATLCEYQLKIATGLPSHFREIYRSRQARNKAFSVAKFVDSIVCLSLDYAIGYYVSQAVQDWTSPQILGSNLYRFPQIFLKVLRSYVVWLMGAPAGFKLNLPLASIMGNGILLWMDLWEFGYVSVANGSIVRFVATMSTVQSILLTLWTHMGISLQLSLVADCVSAVTWNSYWVYLYFAKLNAMQFGLLSSLWKLFLGKKNNILRKRVDTCEYDVNQLLLGTLLFTVLAFLVTTNSVFFVYFGFVRFCVWSCGCLLWLPIVVLRTIPLASILDRTCRPLEYTGSIRLLAVMNQTPVMSMDLSDIAPSKRRSRDDTDQQRLRSFLALSSSRARKTSGVCIFSRVTVSPSAFGNLFGRLRRYRKSLSEFYNAASVINSSLFGSHASSVDLSILFDHFADLDAVHDSTHEQRIRELVKPKME